MAKKKAIKWAIDPSEPEDMEFLSNDDIIAKNTNKKTKEVSWPGKGPWTFRVVNLKRGEIKNEESENFGKPRIRTMYVLSEPKGSDAADWNGFAVFDGFNVTDQGKTFLKRFLKAVGATWDDFLNKSKEDDQDPPHIVQIGKVVFEGTKDVFIRATVRVKFDDYSGDDTMEIARYLPKAGADDDDDDTNDDSAATEDDGVAVMGKGSKGKNGKAQVPDRDDLKAMKPKELKEYALATGVTQKKIDKAGKDKEAIIELVAKKMNLPPF